MKKESVLVIGALLSFLIVNIGLARQPNIVLILADDTGYTDLGAFAEKLTGTPVEEQFYETPALDELTRNGTAFSQAYACPLCSPTRASILTGRYASKIGFTTATPGTVQTFYNQGLEPPEGYLAQDALYWGDKIAGEQALWNGISLQALPAGNPGDNGRDAVTLAEVLNENGYRSAFIGKWHLGGHGSKGYQPADQGFEELAYYDAGGSTYFNWRGIWNNSMLHHPKMAQERLFGGTAGKETGEEYLTDDLAVRASQFIRSHSKENPAQPFFLYFCEFALHAPLEALEKDIKYFEGKTTRGWNKHTNATYAAMNKSMDESVATVVKALEATGQLENTLIVFMSDNGGVSWPLNQATLADETRATSNAPLKGGKAMVYEGGIRVPLLFYWKGKIASGKWVDRPVDCNDIFPTILDLAGIDPEPFYTQKMNYPAIDGRSLLSLIQSPEGKPSSYDRDTFFWHYPFNVIVRNPIDSKSLTPHSAIRKGDYKLIFDWSGRLFLYDLKKDLSEKNNLVEKRPVLTKKLFTELNIWLDENVADRYMPSLHPDYDPAKDDRDYPFVDLRKKMLGEDFAIQPKSVHNVNNLH